MASRFPTKPLILTTIVFSQEHNPRTWRAIFVRIKSVIKIVDYVQTYIYAFLCSSHKRYKVLHNGEGTSVTVYGNRVVCASASCPKSPVL
jgi:hypothetical protein